MSTRYTVFLAVSASVVPVALLIERWAKRRWPETGTNHLLVSAWLGSLILLCVVAERLGWLGP